MVVLAQFRNISCSANAEHSKLKCELSNDAAFEPKFTRTILLKYHNGIISI